MICHLQFEVNGTTWMIQKIQIPIKPGLVYEATSIIISNNNNNNNNDNNNNNNNNFPIWPCF